MENISEHVRRERYARGVTIEELAKGTFILSIVLKDIESGKFDKYKGGWIIFENVFTENC